MESTYLNIERETIRRRRQLNMLKGLRRGATWGIVATLVYLVAVYVGLLGMVSLWILVGFNFLVAWISARMGQRYPIALQDDLYRVDRAFHLSERLSTIYELRKSSGETDFLMALYDRTKELPEDLSKALTLSKSERSGWMMLSGLTLASIVLLGLWFSGVPTLQLGSLFSPSPRETPVTTSLPESPMKRAESPSGELLTVPSREEQDGSPAPSDTAAKPSGPVDSNCNDPQAARLAENQAGTTNCAQAAPGEATPSPREEAPLTNSRAEAQALSQALAELAERLERGEISSEELKEELEQLSQQASSTEAQSTLQQAAESSEDLDEAERQIQEALSRLQRALNQPEDAAKVDSSQQAAAGEQSAQDASSSSQDAGDDPQQQKEEGATSTDQQSTGTGGTGAQDQEAAGDENAGEGTSDSEQSAGKAGEETGPQASSSSSDSQGSAAEGSEDASQEPGSGGDAPGQGPRQGDRASTGSESLPINRNLLIQGGDLPRDRTLLERLLTQGVPVDLAELERNGTPILRLNLDRVEALLELRDLPPDLRNLVRAYFLAITGNR